MSAQTRSQRLQSRNLDLGASIQLTKNVIDVGLSTNNIEPMLPFGQEDVGVRFDYVLPVRRGQKQHRHDAIGLVVKLNQHAEPLLSGNARQAR